MLHSFSKDIRASDIRLLYCDIVYPDQSKLKFDTLMIISLQFYHVNRTKFHTFLNHTSFSVTFKAFKLFQMPSIHIDSVSGNSIMDFYNGKGSYNAID